MRLPPAIRRQVVAQAGMIDRPTAARRQQPTRIPVPLAAPALTIEVVVPLVTVSETNARGHWRDRHRRTRKADEALAAVLMFYGLSGMRLAPPFTVTLTRTGGRQLDTDNLASSLKHIRDAVAEWLGVDDGDPRASWQYDQDRGGAVGVRVRVAT